MASQMEIFFIAGEASGDRHAAPVVAELRRLGFRVTGVGGQLMLEAGAELLVDSTNWGAMGVPEALRKAPGLLIQRERLSREIRRRKPAVLVLVDLGFFNVAMARRLSPEGFTRILYYFPPGSWRREPRDWSPLAAITDCIATPFAKNAEFLKASGANAHWVGHPVVDALAPVQDVPALRRELGIPQGEPTIGLLPGSRTAERRQIGPVMIGAARIIRQQFPGAQFIWSSFPKAGAVETALRKTVDKMGCVTVLPESHDVIRASDFLLVAMGTATLEAAAAMKPMVTTYDASGLAKWIAAKLLHQKEPLYGMPNLMLGRMAVPEIVPETTRDRVTSERLARAALDLLSDEEKLDTMREDLRKVRDMLGQPGAAVRTAALIDQLAHQAPPEVDNQ